MSSIICVSKFSSRSNYLFPFISGAFPGKDAAFIIASTMPQQVLDVFINKFVQIPLHNFTFSVIFIRNREETRFYCDLY